MQLLLLPGLILLTVATSKIRCTKAVGYERIIVDFDEDNDRTAADYQTYRNYNQLPLHEEDSIKSWIKSIADEYNTYLEGARNTRFEPGCVLDDPEDYYRRIITALPECGASCSTYSLGTSPQTPPLTLRICDGVATAMSEDSTAGDGHSIASTEPICFISPNEYGGYADLNSDLDSSEYSSVDAPVTVYSSDDKAVYLIHDNDSTTGRSDDYSSDEDDRDSDDDLHYETANDFSSDDEIVFHECDESLEQPVYDPIMTINEAAAAMSHLTLNNNDMQRGSPGKSRKRRRPQCAHRTNTRKRGSDWHARIISSTTSACSLFYQQLKSCSLQTAGNLYGASRKAIRSGVRLIGRTLMLVGDKCRQLKQAIVQFPSSAKERYEIYQMNRFLSQKSNRKLIDEMTKSLQWNGNQLSIAIRDHVAVLMRSRSPSDCQQSLASLRSNVEAIAMIFIEV
jgi:hypothetical protein